MNGSLHNYDNGLYQRCLNTYKVTFNDGTVKYTRAKCKSDAEDNVSWFGGVDRYDDIVSVEDVDDISASSCIEAAEFWSINVNSVVDAAVEIIRALDAGTNLGDIDDYLAELVDLGKISDSDRASLYNWSDIEIKLYQASVR